MKDATAMRVLAEEAEWLDKQIAAHPEDHRLPFRKRLRSAMRVAVAALAADLGIPLGEVWSEAMAKVEANAERHSTRLATGATARLSVDLPLAAYDRLHVLAASEGVSLSALAVGVLSDAVARADERAA